MSDYTMLPDGFDIFNTETNFEDYRPILTARSDAARQGGVKRRVSEYMKKARIRAGHRPTSLIGWIVSVHDGTEFKGEVGGGTYQ